MVKNKNEFYLCEEDDIYNENIDLYEDVQQCMYTDAPPLDLNIGVKWLDDSLFDDIKEEDLSLEEFYAPYKFSLEELYGYGSYNINFNCGDILLARVYQEGPKMNLKHAYRPFLVIYANAYRAYGFQIGSSLPNSVLQYRVPINDPARYNLDKTSAVMTNFIRGVDFQHIVKYIGTIDEELKNKILEKLYEIKENKDGLYDDAEIMSHLDVTIENVKKIRCRSSVTA